MLATALAGMTQAPQWFVWRLEWLPAEGKYKKVPAWPMHRTDLDPSNKDHRTQAHNAQLPANWRSYGEACQDLAAYQARFDGYSYALGFMFTEQLGYWFLDIDGCVGPDGALSPWATWFAQSLPGAFWEYSSSGKGLHFIGRGQVPAHRTRPTKEWCEQHPDVGLEFYTGGRGIAFGLTGQAWGNADTDHTQVAQWVAANIFTTDAPTVAGAVSVGPRADWRGPVDDADLLRRAMAANKSAAKTFAGLAGFSELWKRDLQALAKTYPNAEPPGYAESEADFALASYLAFWTGCDAERMQRLMLASGLVRPKWSEHKTYLRELTIDRACRMQQTVCCDKEVEPQLSVATTVEACTNRQTYFNQIMSCDDDAELRTVVLPTIACDLGLLALDRDYLAAAAKKRFNEWLFPVSIGDCRALVRPKIANEAVGAPEWANGFVYLMASDSFFSLRDVQPITRTAFCAHHDRLMPSKPNGDKEDAAKWCLQRWNMTTVSDAMYHPAKEPIFEHGGRYYANSYSSATLPEVATAYTAEGAAAIDAFLTHIRAFCGHRAEVVGNLLDWMAWNVQNPGTKCRYMPLLKGVQGDGKTMIVDALRAAMGAQNVGSVGPALLMADFNDWAEGTCVTGFEEMMITGRKRYAVANALKEPIANSALSINRKGRASGKTIVNVTNYIGFSNHVDAVPLEDTDRRYWVVFSPYRSKSEMMQALGFSPEALRLHFANIFASFDDARRGEWCKWLREYPVSAAFNPNGDAPQTDEKREMRNSGEDVYDAIARQVIDGGCYGVTSTVLSSAALGAAMTAICMQDRIDVPKTTAIGHMLARLGFSQLGPIWWDGKTHRIWWRRGLGMSCHAEAKAALDASRVNHLQRV